ncbi:hypothetical protein G7054_g9761 [Neopestalotiopsis clavispora]|nr:hypothetical protein G7054_g9761 [Neopestalotiopsis clavispora]
MASKKVSILKFVGTVSLGLLTGTTYTLSTSTIPQLLELPSASSASKAFRSITSTAATHLNTLTGVAGSAFLLAFALSPRGYRHPYLIYTSVFCFSTRLTDYFAPTLFGAPGDFSQKRAALAKARREKAAARRMEQSYEVLGVERESDNEGSSEDVFEEEINGEEVRSEVELFVKNHLVQTALAGVGFMMAVVGIWGDGVYDSFSETVVVAL